jgi:DNA-binding CsgD family transcriptional regulator
MGMAGFTDMELKIIAWRTNGVKGPEIARRLGCRPQLVYNYIWRIQRKTGLNDVALLTRWAMEHGLDQELGPETSAERPYPGMPKARQQRIKLGRIARMRSAAGR